MEVRPKEIDERIIEDLKVNIKSIYKQHITNLKLAGKKQVKIAKYLLNKNKKEIHRLNTITPLCNLDLIKLEHKLYLRNKKYTIRAMTQGYDGCKHCMSKFHIK